MAKALGITTKNVTKYVDANDTIMKVSHRFRLVLTLLVIGVVVWHCSSIVRKGREEQTGILLDTTSKDKQVQRQLYQDDGNHQISRAHGFVYVHIPKTGGSTIEYSSLFDEKRENGVAPRSHHSIRALLPPHRLMERKLTNFISATHIRHPCERFVSAYYYIMFDKRSKGIRPGVEAFGMWNISNINDFIDFLDEGGIMRWNQLKIQIVHFRPMVSWLLMEDYSFGIDLVLCQDNWNEGVERLVHSLNIDVSDDLFKARNVNENHPTCDSLQENHRESIMREYALDGCLFGYSYNQGDFAIVSFGGINESICIGKHHDRNWFTERYHFCKEALEPRHHRDIKMFG